MIAVEKYANASF